MFEMYYNHLEIFSYPEDEVVKQIEDDILSTKKDSQKLSEEKILKNNNLQVCLFILTMVYKVQ